jgi:hypothetical protein
VPAAHAFAASAASPTRCSSPARGRGGDLFRSRRRPWRHRGDADRRRRRSRGRRRASIGGRGAA